MASLEKLIEDSKQGKRRAQGKLIRKFAPVLLPVAMRYTSNKSDAEDVLQDAMINALQKIESYEGKGSFEGWLKRIVVNGALNHNRDSKKHQYHQPLEDDYLQEEDEYLDSGINIHPDQLIAMIQELPEGYRLVMNMYVFEGFTHKEIAQELNISENTSKSQLAKARKNLKNKLERLQNE